MGNDIEKLHGYGGKEKYLPQKHEDQDDEQHEDMHHNSRHNKQREDRFVREDREMKLNASYGLNPNLQKALLRQLNRPKR